MAKPELERARPHVLALPFPFQGHISPLMELALRLAVEGVTVSFLNIPYYHARMIASIQQGLPIRLLSLPDTYPPPPDYRQPASVVPFLLHIATLMPAEVETLMQTIIREDPDLPLTCLIADIRIPFAQSVADKFRIPRVAFWTQSAASYAYHAMASDGFQPPADESSLIDCIPGVPSHKRSETPMTLQKRPGIAGSFVPNFNISPFRQVAQAAAVVINTFDTLEPEALEAARRSSRPALILSVGPLLISTPFNSTISSSDERATENHVDLRWLDSQPLASVLYVSFGTLACLTETEFEELAIGIEASGQRFLWSLRPGAVGGNPNAFIEAFTERTKDRSMVVPWAPQLQVLSHPSIGGFLTHCGWNSSLESMSRGLPMIGWPKVSEQRINLRCLVDGWKICLSMAEGQNGGFLTRDEVEKKVRMLMVENEGIELRSSCGKLRHAASLAMGEDGTSSNNFNLLVKLVFEAFQRHKFS